MNGNRLFQLRRELGAALAKQKVIYLDINHWNGLCDAVLGSGDKIYEELNDRLKAGVDRGEIACPIEVSVFLELLKQRLPEKRLATTRIIDQLSQAVVIVAPQDRVFLEVLRVYQAGSKGEPFPPAPRSEVWTKAAFLIGHPEAASEKLDKNTLRYINEAVQNELWGYRFEEVLGMVGPDFSISWEWTVSTASKLNLSKLDARERFKTYKELYLSEVRGILDGHADALGSVYEYVVLQGGPLPEPITPQQREQLGREMAAIVHAAFKVHEFAPSLPTVHVLASLFSHVQWDVGRRYKPNDFADFSHASAAVAYCDCFLTERSLATLLKQARLDSLYECTVVSSPEELLAMV